MITKAGGQGAEVDAVAAEHDLVVRGGQVVTAGGQGAADVGVTAGRVAQLGGEMHGRQELDARGALVLPGGVDMHVHLSQPPAEPGEPAWVDDFASGSAAAIAGGITTIGNMTFPPEGQTMRQALDTDDAAASAASAVDYVLHPVLAVPAPEALAELPGLAADGFRTLKIFMVMDEFEAHAAGMVEAIRAAGRLGMLTLLHCEEAALVRFAGEQLVASGQGALDFYAESRPVHAERAAIQRAVAICEATGAPVCIMHLSSAEALDAARAGRARGLPVFVEARPMYLHLTSEWLRGPDAGAYVGAPPLREAADVAALWAGLTDGSVHTIGSDHAPWSKDAKIDPGLDVTTARQGVSDLETALPMLMSAGVLQGRLSLARFAQLTSAGPARLYGVYPRKGTIAVGSDADLTIWDPQQTRTVDGSAHYSRAGYSVYDGQEVRCWPRFVVSRGDVVFQGGQVTAAQGRGQRLRMDAPTEP
jgi:dihydropyrimidinase